MTQRSNPSDRVEQLLRDALHAHVATIDPSPAPPLTTFETSTLTRSTGAVPEQRRRTFALMAAAVLVVVALGGVWWATTERRDAGPVVADRSPGTWTVPAPAPLSPRQFPEVMWTGEEFLVWGGVIGNTGLNDGARYDPTTDTWRPMAPAPADVRPGASAIWAGDRMITASKRAAHAYDPSTDSWSPLGTFEEPPATAFVGDAADVTDVVRSGEQVFAIAVGRNATGDGATLSAWLLDGDVWRFRDWVPIDAGLPALRSSTTADQMSVHDPVALPDGFALWDGERDGWRFSIDGAFEQLPSLEQYDDTGALVSGGRLVAVDGELVVVAVGKTAETDDLRITRLTGDGWSDWEVVSGRAVLGLRVLAAGDRIVTFGADIGGDVRTLGTPRLIDPTTGESRLLDGYPIDTVIDRGAAWSGTHMLVVGGQRSDDGSERSTGDTDTVSSAAALWTGAPDDTTTRDTTTPETTDAVQPPPTTAPTTTDLVMGSTDGPVMRYPRAATDTVGMAAEVRGRLELEGSCLYVALDEVGERYPVLWPAGTRWDPAALAVVPPSGAPLPVGSSVYGGGGYLYVDDVERLAGPEAAALAATCVDNSFGEIAVVNNAPDAVGADPG